MARGKTHEAPIAKLLAVVLFVSLTGTGLTQATEVEHQTSPNGYVSQFGPGFSEVEIVSSAQGLDEPRDLEFHPSPQRLGELWVVNRATDSATIIQNAGNLDQTSETRQDAYGYHFMEEVSAIAFGANHIEFDYQFAVKAVIVPICVLHVMGNAHSEWALMQHIEVTAHRLAEHPR